LVNSGRMSRAKATSSSISSPSFRQASYQRPALSITSANARGFLWEVVADAALDRPGGVDVAILADPEGRCCPIPATAAAPCHSPRIGLVHLFATDLEAEGVVVEGCRWRSP